MMKTRFPFTLIVLGFILGFSNQLVSAQGAFFKAINGRFETNDVRIECEVRNDVLIARQDFTATLLERLLCDKTTDIIPEGTTPEAQVRQVFDCRHVCERDEMETKVQRSEFCVLEILSFRKLLINGSTCQPYSKRVFNKPLNLLTLNL